MKIKFGVDFKDGALKDVDGEPINGRVNDIAEVSLKTYYAMKNSGMFDYEILA